MRMLFLLQHRACLGEARVARAIFEEVTGGLQRQEYNPKVILYSVPSTEPHVLISDIPVLVREEVLGS